MKRLLTVMILSLAAHSQLASANASRIDVEGKPAQALLAVLENLGAARDCGMGSCGTEAQDLSCAIVSGPEKTSYACRMRLQDQTGGMTEKGIVAQEAEALVDAMKAAGAEVGCSGGACWIDTSTVDCQEHGKAEGTPWYSCWIQKAE